MPRNASGTYTLPSGNPVVSGTLIDATWANNTLSDLGNEVTDSLSRSGEGAMLAPLRITDGVQATPALAFSNEPSSGLYRAGSNEWWAVAAGVQNLRFTNTGLTTRAAAGAVGTPSLAAFNDTDTGIYFPGANQLAIATGGVGALWVDSSQNVGIGTASPTTLLDVYRGSYGITAAFRAYDGTNNPRLIIYGTSSGTVLQNTFSATAGNLIFAVGGAEGSGTEVGRFDDLGRFSIGNVFAENSIGVYLLPTPETRVKSNIENGSSQISIYNVNTLPDAEQFFVGMNVSDVDIGNKRAGALKFYTNGSERARITSAGNIVAGASVALATTATDGFLYVPTCAGTPTGTPTAITGMAPIVVNTTNNKLYFYSGGAWRDAGP